jgi:phenylalanyl-tRNA synthetase beta chain
MILAVAGGRVDGGILGVGAEPAPRSAVALRPSRVRTVLGAEVSVALIAQYLTSVGFAVQQTGETLTVTPPSWRNDVTRDVDLIEEVARLHGYDKLPDTIEAYRPTTVPDHPLYIAGRRVRDALVAAGLSEVRPMPFVKGDDASHWRVTNPLAEDEPHLRTSMLESLARRAEYNLTRMLGDIRIFEVGSVFLGKGQGKAAESLGEEVRVGLLIMGARHPQHFAGGAPAAIDAWDAKGLAERVARAAFPGAAVTLVPGEDGVLWTITAGERVVGTVTRVALDAPVWASAAFGIELTLGAMPLAYVAKPGTSAHAGVRPPMAPPARAVRYTPLPVTPAAAFDLALLVPDTMRAAEVERVLRTSGGDMLESLVLFDEFRGAGVPDGMRSIAWRLTFRHPERTLRDKEIDGRRSQLLKSLENQLGVKPRTA